MEQILAIRAFVPARDYAVSKRFYQALGFVLTHDDPHVSFLKLNDFSFILQNFYKPEMAENLMLQILVRDVDRWWQGIDGARLVAEFAVKPPVAPSVQAWGMKVGFIHDPSGVLWHVAEVPF
jgi:catechol 2,3-dioxygenase-like lactoylglutathione lyase family enzyme